MSESQMERGMRLLKSEMSDQIMGRLIATENLVTRLVAAMCADLSREDCLAKYLECFEGLGPLEIDALDESNVTIPARRAYDRQVAHWKTFLDK